MKLIMVVSADGYVAREANDDMSWAGPTDKAVFRLLTMVGSHLACGEKTFNLMKGVKLPGRTLHVLSRCPYHNVVYDLKWFNRNYPTGWLIGGQKLAMRALNYDMVDQAFICVSTRKCFPTDSGVECELHNIIHDRGQAPRFYKDAEVKIGDMAVHVWHRNGH